MGRILAIDYGSKRVGLAVTDPLQIIAQPLETVAAVDCLEYLKGYLGRESVERVIIGMPIQDDGSPSDSQRFIRPFLGRLKKEFPGMEIVEVDESYSSVEANRAIREGGVSRNKRREKTGIVDRTAATLILQRYMDGTAMIF